MPKGVERQLAAIGFSEDADDLIWGSDVFSSWMIFLSGQEILSLEMGQFIGSQPTAKVEFELW